MDCSTPGLPVHYQLLEFTQTHVHWVGDAIQPSHPLSSPSPPAPNPSQHQSQLFAWGGQSTGVSALVSFLPKKSQGWSPSEWTDWISLQSKGLSRVFSNTWLSISLWNENISCHINQQEMLWPSAISGLQIRMRAPKTKIQRMLPPPMLITEESGECKKQDEQGNRIAPS